jgi:hypothetical protein
LGQWLSFNCQILKFHNHVQLKASAAENKINSSALKSKLKSVLYSLYKKRWVSPLVRHRGSQHVIQPCSACPALAAGKKQIA